MKEITHGVDENHAWRSPAQRLVQPLRPQRQIKAALEGMSRRSAKPLGKTFRVAMVATGADLCAAGDRIPSGVRPLNIGQFSHWVADGTKQEHTPIDFIPQ